MEAVRNRDCVPLQSSGGTAAAQVVHTQQRTAAAPTASTELVTIASTQGVRAVTSVTASAVVTTNLTPVQTQTRSLVTQVTPGNNLVFRDFFQGYVKGPRICRWLHHCRPTVLKVWICWQHN